MRRVALAVLLLVTSLAVGSTFSAHGALQRGAGHGPGDRGFSVFAVDAQSPLVVYAGSGAGVFKSVDAGRSWQAVNAGLTDPYTFDLVISQQQPAALYAATARGVFKSTNGGRSWRRTSAPSLVPTALALHPRDPRVIYAADDHGVHKSGDAGASWRKVTTARRVYALVIDPRRPATVYAGSGNGVLKSTDGGRTWKAMNRGLFPNEKPDRHSLLEGFVNVMVVDPRRPQTLVLACDRGVYRSTDGASTWRAVNSGLAWPRFVRSLAIDPAASTTVYAGIDAPRSGLFKQVEGGRRWRAIVRPGGGGVVALALDPTDPETIYLGTRNAKAFKSTDGGRTWTALPIPLP